MHSSPVAVDKCHDSEHLGIMLRALSMQQMGGHHRAGRWLPAERLGEVLQAGAAMSDCSLTLPNPQTMAFQSCGTSTGFLDVTCRIRWDLSCPSLFSFSFILQRTEEASTALFSYLTCDDACHSWQALCQQRIPDKNAGAMPAPRHWVS